MPLALMGKDIVILTLIVMGHFSVAMTTVGLDLQVWTVVQVGI